MFEEDSAKLKRAVKGQRNLVRG